MLLRRLLVTCLLALTPAVAACERGGGTAQDRAGNDSPATAGPIERDPANASVSLTIGSKNFTEQRVLAEIYAQGLQAAGYRVRTRLDLGDESAALRALKSGRIDAYPEYTGTALLSFFGVRAGAIPRDPTEAYERAREGFEKQGLVAFEPTPFTSSNEVAVTQATAEREGLQRISDLQGRAKDLTLFGSPECDRRQDCLIGLREVYGLRFKRFVEVEIPKRHDVLINGRADVSIVFTTDPQIKREGFVLLEDDRGMFPPNNSTLVMRREVAERAGPDLRETIERLQRELTDEVMQELNARVDLDDKDPKAVAREDLRETELLAG